jgi:uncharacterized protein YajQ (UPF0234 family)
MPQDFSFDVVSKVDMQAIDNALNTANREITQRFDFKGSVSRLELDKKEGKITLYSDNESKLKSVVEILQGRLVRQGIQLKALDFQKLEIAEGATVRQVAKITQGIESEKAKEIIKAVKDSKLKVQASIQSDHVRVSGRSKDDLQAAMTLIRGGDYGLPLQFENYR